MSFEIITFLTTGFLLGLQHSIDTDHVIAVSTMVSENRNLKKSAVSGAFWGLGHTTTLFIAGFLILILKLSLLAKFSNFFEGIVGIVLIYLGISLGMRIKKEQVHIHSHDHNGQKHIHLHSHKESKDHKHKHKSYLVGLAHGLAGSAALMLIVLSTAESALIGLLFILVFGVGSVIGMAVFGLLAGVSFTLLDKRLKSVSQFLKFAIASASIAIGLSIILQSI